MMHWWADAQFLVMALSRLKRTAVLAKSVLRAKAEMVTAINAFDAALPGLKNMRDISEHVDAYGRDDGNESHTFSRKELQVGSWDGTTCTWLGYSLNVDVALQTAKQLYDAVSTLSCQNSPRLGGSGPE